jgi:ribonuclease VapC
MVIDSSALLAILFDEPEASKFLAKISDSRLRYVGAPTLVELTIVAQSRRGPDVLPILDQFLRGLNLTVVDFTAVHVEAAKAAFSEYGKGQQHQAQLNFGDCLCYAIAKVEAMPLLFKGEDFALTDVERPV